MDAAENKKAVAQCLCAGGTTALSSASLRVFFVANLGRDGARPSMCAVAAVVTA